MSTDFPFVQIPKELEPVIGVPDPGTHIYRHSGSHEEAGAWFELLTEVVGSTVSPGGVGMVCPVSRAAVHKRLKEGRLTIFLFYVTHRKTTLFGQNKILRGEPYGYVPVSECRAWREELEERAVSQGRITWDELEGAKPDWHGEFLKWRNKKERFGMKEQLAELDMTVGDLVKDVFKGLLGTLKPTSPEPKPTKRKK